MKCNWKYIIPCLLTTTSIFSSNLYKDDAKEEVLTRKDYLNYNLNVHNDIATTLKVNFINKCQQMPTYVQRSVFNDEINKTNLKNEPLYINHIPAISGSLILSDEESGKILHIDAEYQELLYGNHTIKNKWGCGESIEFNKENNGEDSVDYEYVNTSSSNQELNINIGIQGYSLEYKSSAFSALMGLCGNASMYGNEIMGYKYSEDEKVKEGRGLSTLQQSFGGGVWGGVRSNITISEGEFSAIFVTANLQISNHLAYNKGYYTSFDHEQDGDDSYNDGTDICPDSTLYPTKFTSHYGTKGELSVSFASIPGKNDEAMFMLNAGVGNSLSAGKDVMFTKSTGFPTDIVYNYVFFGFSLTI